MMRSRSISIATVLFSLGLVSVASLVMSAAAKSAAAAGPKDESAAPAERHLAHMVFFTLKESNDENRKKLIDAAKEYLGGHPGELYFSVGAMTNLKEPVSVTDFDVALHVVFADKAAHDEYLVSERHHKFVAVSKELNKKVRVFDSVLEPASGNTAQPK